MKKIEDIKEFEDIDTYYEISKMVEEIFEDRVEAHKHLVSANKEIARLNNIINELQWKPIEKYEKPKYDWVLVKYYIKPEFECIPTVAEERFGKWYDRNDNEIIGEVRYFMDMQLLDKLKELKENNK